MTKRLAFVLGLILLLQAGWSAPAPAQTPIGFIAHVSVYVNNKEDGTPVPSRTVYLTELNPPSNRGASVLAEPTNLDGVATFSFLTLPGPWEIKIFGGSLFSTFTETFELSAGQSAYELYADLEPKVQRPSTPSNKYLHQQGRALHIRVVGRSKDGKQSQVHYAAIFDNSGAKIATTGYDGTVTVKHNEAIGETVTLRAEPAAMPGNDQWEAGSASFIVGAVEKGLRTTRSEDYVTIVLGSNGAVSEKHPLDVIVRGMKNGKRRRIADASILDSEGHRLGTTDAAGQATVIIDVPLGETYSVKAEAKHWKSATETLQSGSMQGGVTPTYAHESVEFTLEPAEETGTLTVEVLDKETDKPVSGATVTLYKPDKFPGTQVGRSSTNGKGEATFDAEEIDRALLNGEARVEASRSEYDKSIQTVSSSLTTGGAPHYVLYIGKTAKTNWTGTWTNGPYTIQISGGESSLSYQFVRSEGEGTCCPLVDKGSASCKVQGSEATCIENAHYHDSDKDVQRVSDIKLSLSGDTISSVAKVRTASISLSHGQHCADISQCTALHPGAEFSATFIRKKP